MMDLDEIKDLIFDVRGCAFNVWNEYKWGFSENVYEAALELLLTDKGYKVDRQVFLQCFYKGRPTRQTYRMDLLVNDELIIENKSVSSIIPEHRGQLFNYAHLFQKPYCMLINFGPTGLQSECYFVHLDTRKVDFI